DAEGDLLHCFLLEGMVMRMRIYTGTLIKGRYIYRDMAETLLLRQFPPSKRQGEPLAAAFGLVPLSRKV
ncbi:MAG TPA: hypothetical protein P5165_04950, partial [Spirochaetia bacterium]|nr:hypothetical protein [Spirochaetia bacterium]